jgi:hypothetical protein
VTPGKDAPRDWDKELAQIDKLIAADAAGAPPAVPAPARAAAGVPRAGGAAPGGPGSGRQRLFTWLRLLLALALGAGISQWPYVHGCGVPLFGYLGAVLAVIVASFWSMVSSWRSRAALAHFLSIGLLFWGAALAAREVLPRVGYARQQASWLCESRPGPAPAAQPAAPPEPSTSQSAPAQSPTSQPGPL